ncbi:hypothetical protein ACF068_13280 [Streptomyces sp. NPDC016309]|uniref:hypothetical protein n=1 Tax=Streptomyces sp. NPDC016309 TaxID=3364965 RepID=UPI0036FFF440
MFVDESGRRARFVWAVGILVALACIAFAALLALALVATGDADLAPSGVLLPAADTRTVAVR